MIDTLTDYPVCTAQQLHKMVDGFTVMTYDASRPERPGFNAPLPWVENNVRLLVDADHAVEQRAKVDKLDEELEPCALHRRALTMYLIPPQHWLSSVECLRCSPQQDMPFRLEPEVAEG